MGVVGRRPLLEDEFSASAVWLRSPDPGGRRDGEVALPTDPSDAEVSPVSVVPAAASVSCRSAPAARARPPPEVDGVGKSCCWC